MGTPGPFELLIIFLVILLVFGAKRIPEIARGLGKGIQEFKSATREISKEFSDDLNSSNRIQAPPPPAQAPAPRTTAPAEQKASDTPNG
ncbi:MAG: sec-independent protein translocase protein TatA [Rhodothermales bacterium]|jgi:sec-independent protein translocase protein TatA